MSTQVRRLPRWSELKGLLSLRAPKVGAAARLARAGTIDDLRRIARRRIPRAVFDYVDGAAEDEITLARNRASFRRIEFHPSVLRDVSKVDLTTTLLGRPSAMPLGLAPTGFTRMMHHQGEPAVARAAHRAGLVYTLSTLGTTSAPALSAAAPDGINWFQLYLPRDRGFAADLITAAESAGFAALVLTVDTAVAGIRHRDRRNGLSFPPALTLRTLGGMARHPRWWYNVLTTEPLAFASLEGAGGDSSMAQLLDQVWDPALSLDDLAWVRARWSGPLVVKGVQTVDDAQLVVGCGADAVTLSNHGGRQLDRTVTPLLLLPSVIEQIDGGAEIYIDGGISNGADVIAAVALGARACFVGRAYLYGLMAGGEPGVERAIEILGSQMQRTMQLLGVRNLAELNNHHVSFAPTGV
jgi:L-lactate dehydrogenase (cytochrome)